MQGLGLRGRDVRLGFRGNIGVILNQMENKMEHEMETGVL